MDDSNNNQSVSEKGLGSKVIPGHMVINPNEDERARWYVVHTYSGHEARVAETLRQRVATLGQTEKVFELLIPTQDKIQIRHGKKSTVKEKIFPGYLLVKMIFDDDSWLVVRTTQGVTGFVGVGNKPTPLSVKEVEAIMQFASMGAPKYKTNFSIGEAVKITDGPFSDFLGSVESIDEEHGKIRVLVSIFGRETPVELDFLQVKKI
jgi:transcription termination/antitermination protein NusG